MKRISAALRSPVSHVVLLTALMAIVFVRSHIVPQDDHFAYLRFIQALARGRVDLSIPGFHGASFLAFPLYALTGSAVADIYVQILCAVLLPAAAAFAAYSLLKDRFQTILFAYAVALSPFLAFVALRGFTFPSFTLLMLLTLGLRARGSCWAFLPWSISLITKPFSIALFPFFLLWQPEAREDAWARGWVQMLLALPIPLLYVALQISQVGRIIVGAHPEINQANVFVWARFPLNAAHGIQMLFSIHNFYFPDPARTGMGNLVHSSPLLMVFGLLSLLYPRTWWKDRRLAAACTVSMLAAFTLAALLDHMDHFYMETTVLILALSSLPFIVGYQRLLPVILFTLHFQFLYLYLWGRGTYFTDYSLFLIPLVADAVFLTFTAVRCAPAVGRAYRRLVR